MEISCKVSISTTMDSEKERYFYSKYSFAVLTERLMDNLIENQYFRFYYDKEGKYPVYIKRSLIGIFYELGMD